MAYEFEARYEYRDVNKVIVYQKLKKEIIRLGLIAVGNLASLVK